MKMTRDYFNARARVAIQFKTRDGGKFYEYSAPNNVDEHIRFMELTQHCAYIGKTYDNPQDDDLVENFLDSVRYRMTNIKAYKGMTFDEAVEYALNAD